MDSANSGSMQSSSGGDEEFDSRPPFFNPIFSHLSNPQHHLSLLDPHQEHTLLDPLSQNFFHTFSQSPQNLNLNTSLLNLHRAESRELRSDLDCTNLTGSILNAQFGSSQDPAVPSMHLRANSPRCSSPSDQTQAPARNPKKRTRASRRAPTTVLTTDTSNFRAMVQEFTGIPAPSFSASPYTGKLDLFGPIMRSSAGGRLEPVVSSLYPLCPSAEKVHQQSPILLSTYSSSLSSSSSPFMSNKLTESSNQLPSEFQNLSNIETQMFSFQSVLPTPVLHPSHDVPSKSQLPLNSLEEIGMGQSQGQVHANLKSHGKNWINHGNNQDQLSNMNNSSSDFHHEKD